MANYKRKPNYKAKKSCGLCNPHKRDGNSSSMDTKQIRIQKAVYRELITSID